MDVQKDDKFYIISAEWLKRWKTYVNYDGMGGGDFPGPINNEDIIEEEKNSIICEVDKQFLNINLKDGLREEDHFVILNPEIWEFLSKRYGGRMI